MAVRFQLRRDTAANWTSANSVLALGEPGVETDTLKVKVGDGSTAWNSLAYSITKDFTDLTSTPTTLAGYGITDALALAGLSVTQNAASGTGAITYNNATGVFSYTPPNFEGLNGNFTGSVFADDSTIMVDGVAGKIVGQLEVSNPFINGTIDSTDSSPITITPDVVMSAGLTIGNHIIPSSSENIDLGSASARFRDLYLSGNSAVIGDLALKRHTSGGLLVSDHSTGNATNLTTHDITANNITTAGYLRGPASFVIDPAAFGDDTGTVVIAGNLQVDGLQTTINSTTVSIDDLNFSIATDAADSAAANGAGITVGGAGATLNYTHATTSWDMNKPLNVTGNIGVTGTVDGVDIQTLNTTAGAALPKAGGTMTGNIGFTGSSTKLSSTGGIYAELGANVNHTFSIKNTTSSTNTVSNVLTLSHYSTGTSAAGFGSAIKFEGENPGGGTSVYGSVGGVWEGASSDPSGGALVFSTDGYSGGNTERVRINSTGNVGIGTDTPGDKLAVAGNIAVTGTVDGVDIATRDAILTSTTTTAGAALPKAGGTMTGDLLIQKAEPIINLRRSDNALLPGLLWQGSAGAQAASIRMDGDSGSANSLVMSTYNGSSVVERLRILTGAADGIQVTGNVGIGVTPNSSWHANWTALQLGTTGFVGSFQAGTTDLTALGSNTWSDGTYKYIETAQAAIYKQQNGKHIFDVAASGTANAAISWTTALTIDNAGKVGIGTDTPTEALEVAGTALVENAKLKAIATDISDTAVDVFVYDTSKDSDGGAWRKRTQRTSWYNETLNTATRGARKEFPSVAVIVARDTFKVTIYDGDDPDMPMWMVFNADASTGGGVTAAASAITTTKALFHVSTLNSTAGLNGQLIIGTGNWHLFNFNFVTDEISFHAQYGSFGAGQAVYSNLLNGRNSAGIFARRTSVGILPNSVNDIAITVQPGAPIDPISGLPVPTIAAATSGGISLINNDGVVVNYTNTQDSSTFNFCDNVFFRGDGAMVWQADSSGNTAAERFTRVVHAPQKSGSFTESSVAGSNALDEFYAPNQYAGDLRYLQTPTGVKASSPHGKTGLAAGQNNGLNIISPNLDTPTEGLISYVTSDYNTGWMNGDIKLATLSDTRTTSLSGTNRCAADNFSSGWTVSTGSNMSIGSNVLAVVDTSNTGASFCDQTITTIVGQEYVIEITATGTSGTGIGLYVTGHGGPVLGYAWQPTYSFTATTTSTVVRLYRFEGHTGSGTITSVIIKEAASDRSYNGNGVSAFGTVPKTAVATGAELVAYGPFTTSNYLQQTYNSDLNFGTGDFMYSLWIYRTSLPTSTHERWFGTVASDGTERIDIFSNANTDNIAFFSVDGGATRGDVRITGIGIGVWHCLHFTRQGNVHKAYHNGELRGTNTGSATLANYGADTDRRTHIGAAEHWDSGHAVLDGKIALAKISGTAPSAEQIKKMYNDEKHLFRENAKATLYSTNNAVTALAYDEDTDLLHVGTGAGRSVFQGLRRIDNTTTSAGVAISASNGLVAEE